MQRAIVMVLHRALCARTIPCHRLQTLPIARREFRASNQTGFVGSIAWKNIFSRTSVGWRPVTSGDDAEIMGDIEKGVKRKPS
jgi:hypothetical protein